MRSGATAFLALGMLMFARAQTNLPFITNQPTTTTGCPSSCRHAGLGPEPCDAFVSTTLTCETLESSNGCDCGGCACTPPEQCPSTCDIGDGAFTCEQQFNRAGRSCSDLEQGGCTCFGCACGEETTDEVTTMPAATTTPSLQCSATCGGNTCDELLADASYTDCQSIEDDFDGDEGCSCDGCGCIMIGALSQVRPLETESSVQNSADTWTKRPGFRCARDFERLLEEWWYYTLIKSDYATIDACKRDCEQDKACAACDYNTSPFSGGKFRSFRRCDLREAGRSTDEYIWELTRANPDAYLKAKQECHSKETCSYWDKIVNTRHYDDFGIFTGGMLELISDREDERYDCTDSAAIATQSAYCLEWTVEERDEYTIFDKVIERESGSCSCLKEPILVPWIAVPYNERFCAQWQCGSFEQTITQGSSSCYYRRLDTAAVEEMGAEEQLRHNRRLREASPRRLRVYGGYGYRSCSSRYTSDQEINNCACTAPSSNGNFCLEWYCQETLGQGVAQERIDYSFTIDDWDELESEQYQCTATDGGSTLDQAGGRWCTKWTGKIVGREEFELTDCHVTAFSSRAGAPPSAWSCDEEGWHFWKRTWWFIIMYPIISSFAVLFVGTKMAGFKGIIILLAIVIPVGILAATMVAGLAGFLVLLAVYTPLIVAAVLLALKMSN